MTVFSDSDLMLMAEIKEVVESICPELDAEQKKLVCCIVWTDLRSVPGTFVN